MSYETIAVSHSEQVTTITLNRPNQRNAMNPAMHAEMLQALADVEADDDCRVLVITGAGEAFCSGMDVKQFFQETQDDPLRRVAIRKQATEWMFKRLRLLPKPTIAAVNGWCMGGGFCILGACDFAIASQSAVFGLSEVNWGIIPAGGAGKIVAQLMAPRDAIHTIMTGKTFTGAEASTMRLVNSAVPREELDGAVAQLATELKKKNPLVLAYCKEVFRVEQNLSLEDAIAWEAAKWHELDWVGKGQWKSGASQFKDEKAYKPGLDSYDFKRTDQG